MVLPRERLVLSALSARQDCRRASSRGGLPALYGWGCRNRTGPSFPLGLHILTESRRFGMKGCEDAVPAADPGCLLPWHVGTLHRFPEEQRAGSTGRRRSPAAAQLVVVCTQCMVLPLFHLSSEICCASGEAQAGLKGMLCFRSRACSFMGWLGLLLQQLSSSSSSPCVMGSWSLLPPQGAEEHR